MKIKKNNKKGGDVVLQNNVLDLTKMNDEQLAAIQQQLTNYQINKVQGEVFIIADKQNKLETQVKLINEENQDKFAKQDEKIDQVVNNTLLTPEDAHNLTLAVQQRAYALVRDIDIRTYFEESEDELDKVVVRRIFPRIYGGLKKKFKVHKYSYIKKVDYEQALSFVSKFKPVLY